MPKLSLTLAIALLSLFTLSCDQLQDAPQPELTPPETTIPNSQATPATPTSTASPTQVESTATSANQPQVGTIKNIVQGDLMCYLTVVDENGATIEVGASFEICEQQATFLNKKVRMSYETVQVNDCQSAEPCGKTRPANLVTRMELAES